MHPPVRLAEILSALSLATDLAMGQPMEHGLRTCLLSERLATRLQLGPEPLHDVFELALLRWVGCTAHAYELSAWFDDEIAAHERSAAFDFGHPLDVVADLLRHAGSGRPLPQRVRTVAGALASGPGAVHDLFSSSCEVAGRLADQFRLGDGVKAGLAHVFARWDGRGWPAVKGDQVAPIARVVHVAQDAAFFHRVGGSTAATGVIRRRSGQAYDPEVAHAFLAAAAELLEATEQPSLWDAVLDAEPGRPRYCSRARSRGRWKRWPTLPTSSRPGRRATRGASPASWKRPPGRRAPTKRRRQPSATRRWCTTSGGWVCPTGSGTRVAPSRLENGSGSASTPT